MTTYKTSDQQHDISHMHCHGYNTLQKGYIYDLYDAY